MYRWSNTLCLPSGLYLIVSWFVLLSDAYSFISLSLDHEDSRIFHLVWWKLIDSTRTIEQTSVLSSYSLLLFEFLTLLLAIGAFLCRLSSIHCIWCIICYLIWIFGLFLVDVLLICLISHISSSKTTLLATYPHWFHRQHQNI